MELQRRRDLQASMAIVRWHHSAAWNTPPSYKGVSSLWERISTGNWYFYSLELSSRRHALHTRGSTMSTCSYAQRRRSQHETTSSFNCRSHAHRLSACIERWGCFHEKSRQIISTPVSYGRSRHCAIQRVLIQQAFLSPFWILLFWVVRTLPAAESVSKYWWPRPQKVILQDQDVCNHTWDGISLFLKWVS